MSSGRLAAALFSAALLGDVHAVAASHDANPASDEAGPSTERNEDLNLAVGETKTLSAKSVRSFSEGNKDIVDVRLTPDSSRFVIVGQHPGSSTLLLLNKDNSQLTFNINVFARPTRVVERELLQLLDGVRGIRMRQIGGRFFVEGEVSTEAAVRHVASITALFPGQAESLVTVGTGALGREVNIRIDFIFAEFDRTKSYQVGVAWPSRVGGQGIASLTGTQQLLGGSSSEAHASVVDQPLPGLDLASSSGWAKVLKHSTVISASGSEAQFSSGGEQNYVVSTGFSAQLTQIHFGTEIKVLPQFDAAANEVRIKLEADVTDLTPPVAAGTNLPGRNVSKLSTSVSLKLGQSIVLSGIRTRSRRHSKSGLPLLSEIPVLGVLFGSHGDTSDDVDGAIFVVPSIIDAVPRGAEQVVDQALREYEEYSGEMQRRDENARARHSAAAPKR